MTAPCQPATRPVGRFAQACWLFLTVDPVPPGYRTHMADYHNELVGACWLSSVEAVSETAGNFPQRITHAQR
eukprot:4460959-Prymnesium_polylepis.1